MLVAHDVSLGEADSSLRLDQVRVIPDVLGSVLSMQLKIADLQIEGLQVHLQQGEDGQWTAQGLPVRADAEPLAPAVILASLQRIGWLSLLNSQVIVQAHGQAPVALTYVNFSLRSQGSRQRLDGRLVLPDGQPLALRLSSRLHPKVWREAELARARKLLSRGDDPIAVMEALSKGLTQKMLHGAMAELHAGDAESRERARHAIEHFFLRGNR